MNDNEKDLSLNEELESEMKSIENIMNTIKLHSTMLDEYLEFLIEVDKAALRYRMKNPVIWPERFSIERDMTDFNTVQSLISDIENTYNKMLETVKDNLMTGSNVYDHIDGPNGMGAVKGDLENLRTLSNILNTRTYKSQNRIR